MVIAPAATLTDDADRGPLGHPQQPRRARRRPRPRRRGRRRLAPRRRRRATAPSPTRSSAAWPGSGRSASAATTTRRPSAAPRSSWFNPDARAAMEWTRGAIVGRRPALAGRACPERRIGGRLHARPRQPARPDLGVRHVGRRRPSRVSTLVTTTHGLHGHTHVPIAFIVDDGRVVATLRPRTAARPALDGRRGAAQPGQRRPAARRRPAGQLPGPRPGRRSGDLAPGRLRHRGGPGGDARGRPAGAAWPSGSRIGA